MGGLAEVRTAGIDVVIRTDGNVNGLVIVAIQVADEEIAAPVGSGEPPLKCTGDARAELAERLIRQLR